jgi:hypothetical protein
MMPGQFHKNLSFCFIKAVKIINPAPTKNSEIQRGQFSRIVASSGFFKGLTLHFSSSVSDGVFFTKDAFKAVQNNGSGLKKGGTILGALSTGTGQNKYIPNSKIGKGSRNNFHFNV